MLRFVLVAYRTRPGNDIAKLVPGRASSTDTNALVDHWSGTAPFASTLDSVVMACPTLKRVTGFAYRPPDSADRLPICLAVPDWLRNIGISDPDTVRFVGFDIHRFFQVLAADALQIRPALGILVDWWANRLNLIEMHEALFPGPVNIREIATRIGAKLPDDWKAPGENVHADLDLLGELTVRMGLL